MRAGTTLGWILAAGLIGGAVFLVPLGYRTDYAGHFLAGFGGTLALFAVSLALGRPAFRWEAVGIVIASIALGAWLEATRFKIAIFDPVDFANQSLGAVLAGAALWERRPSASLVAGTGVLAILFLGVGFLLAFA